MSAARPYIPRAGERAPRAPRFPQSRKNQLRIWWREIDRVLLGLVLVLMVLGTIAVAAASPASARRLSTSAVHLPDLYFWYRHLVWQILALGVLVGVSMMSRDGVRRAAILGGGFMLAMLVLVPVIGIEKNGATRWINIGMEFQPSEFLKPAFAVMLAWIVSWRARDPNIPVIPITAALTGTIVALLMLQPNFGEAILFMGAWFAVVLLAGLPLQRIGMLTGSGVALVVLSYAFYDNARHRIDSFLGGGTAFDQVDLASRTLNAGGWTGSGIWLGTRKMQLPEAHTDYIFSVIGEEFGLLTCGVIVVLYLAIVLRVVARLVEEENLFTILSAAGLIALFGAQAFINILVNLQLFPSKGMTLPLISYGGSSTVAQCLTIGMLLAITRRNPFLSREKFDLRGAIEKGAA